MCTSRSDARISTIGRGFSVVVKLSAAPRYEVMNSDAIVSAFTWPWTSPARRALSDNGR